MRYVQAPLSLQQIKVVDGAGVKARFGDVVGSFKRIGRLRRNRSLRTKLLRPLPIRIRLHRLRFRLFEIRGGTHFARLALFLLRFGQRDVRGVNRIINLCENGAFFDRRAVINRLSIFVFAKRNDLAGDLRAKLGELVPRT